VTVWQCGDFGGATHESRLPGACDNRAQAAAGLHDAGNAVKEAGTRVAFEMVIAVSAGWSISSLPPGERAWRKPAEKITPADAISTVHFRSRGRRRDVRLYLAHTGVNKTAWICRETRRFNVLITTVIGEYGN